MTNYQPREPAALAVSVSDAATMISLGRTRLYEEISSGKLRSFKLGRRRMIPVAALEEWLADREAEAQSENASHRS